MSLAVTTAQEFANPNVERFVDAWVKHCRPDEVVWCDGSEEEDWTLRRQMVRAGTLRQLDHAIWPNSHLALSDPRDVARVENRTFICTTNVADAGPTNNWMAPGEMRASMWQLFAGSMRGRTMYVVPYCMGPLGSPFSRISIMVTDSPYAVVSMRIMARMGIEVLRAMTKHDDFIAGVHSVGVPLESGQPDVPWPCNPDNITISHFPERQQIWSFGSGYGGNALLGKKCLALRLGSAAAVKEGWLAEHMLIIRVTSPEDKVHYLAAAFPSACGKTNFAMMQPALPGWGIETLGDDIAWMRFGDDGRLYAINPEAGFFGVVPHTSPQTNPHMIEAMGRGNVLFTNVAYTEAGDIWWEGIGHSAPSNLRDWRGQPWCQGQDTPAAHPNARAAVPLGNLSIADAYTWDDPAGVPISAILYGGRRPNIVPLVREARNWTEAVFGAATLASETTAAAEGPIGRLRFDPSAMKPFLGCNVGDYYRHWLELANKAPHPGALPEVFFVNWFRKNADNQFLWPGFGENARVLEWIFRRLDDQVGAHETPIGLLPHPEDLNLDGLDLIPEALAELTSYSPAAWAHELAQYNDHLDSLGDRLPVELHQWLEQLRSAVASEQ